MTATTSIKLPDTLKEQIAKTAAREGKTSHALMVETLQNAMDDSALRQQLYEDGEAAYQDMVKTNMCYDGDAVHAYLLAKVRGEKPAALVPLPYDPSKPMMRP